MRSVAVAGVLLVALIVACANGDAAPGSVPEEPPNDGAAQTLVAEDGVELSATLFMRDRDHLVIFLHGYDYDQSTWFPVARALSSASALTLDFRGHGASEGEPRDQQGMLRDVRAAIEFGRERGYEEIALVGASMGGTAAIIIAADDPSLAGTIALSAPASFGAIDAQVVASDVRVPLTLMAAEDDVSALDSLQGFQRAAERAGFVARTYPGTEHGTELLNGEQGDEVQNDLAAELRRFWQQRSQASAS